MDIVKAALELADIEPKFKVEPMGRAVYSFAHKKANLVIGTPRVLKAGGVQIGFDGGYAISARFYVFIPNRNRRTLIRLTSSSYNVIMTINKTTAMTKKLMNTPLFH